MLQGKLGFIMHDFLLGMQKKEWAKNHSQTRMNIQKQEFTPSHGTMPRPKASSHKLYLNRNELRILDMMASGVV